MLMQSKEDLNDFADYDRGADAATMTAHTSVAGQDQYLEWNAWRLSGAGGTALHFEGLMIRPVEQDLKVKTLSGCGRDWPICRSELEPWLIESAQETNVSAQDWLEGILEKQGCLGEAM